MANDQFAARLIEACGTSEAARIQRMLKISYQAAKNYLGGRLPDAGVLLRIAENTPYSLHWLLTGEGEKLVAASRQDTPIPARQIRALIREECEAAISDLLGQTAGERIVVLRPESIKSEKVSEPGPNSVKIHDRASDPVRKL